MVTLLTIVSYIYIAIAYIVTMYNHVYGHTSYTVDT